MPAPPARDGAPSPASGRRDARDGPPAVRRLLAVLAVGALPWAVLVGSGVEGYVFAWGLANPATGHLVTVTDYLFRYTAGPATLPDRLLLWPTSALLYTTAVAGALAGVAGREDRRVTGALLALAGLNQLLFALGLGRTGLTALPTGAVLLWAVAWWGYAGALRRSLPAS